jgi:GNAT superfamily N-acetyltransferase
VLSQVHEPEGVSWLDAEDDEGLVGVVAGALAASPDACDAAAVAVSGAELAAPRLLDAPPARGVSRQAGRWSMLTFHGKAAAFVLPVTYDNCARDGLDEATIFHMGVLPEHRGRGLGRLLLRQATPPVRIRGVAPASAAQTAGLAIGLTVALRPGRGPGEACR